MTAPKAEKTESERPREATAAPRSVRHSRAAGAKVEHEGHHHQPGALPGLMLGAIGIVAEVTRANIFGILSRNSRTATSHVKLPPGQVIEIGTQIDL